TPPNPLTTPPNPLTTPPNPPTTPPHPLMNMRGFMCLQLGSEELFTIRNVTSANPPSITFASNIPRLDHVWDDERPSWDPEDCSKNLLSINGTPIALRYWQD
ncbi:hypothetical protein EV359DRAFT_9544, partial [Lentinula novae-zelandiae]